MLGFDRPVCAVGTDSGSRDGLDAIVDRMLEFSGGALDTVAELLPRGFSEEALPPS